jgi:hypothetical protein
MILDRIFPLGLCPGAVMSEGIGGVVRVKASSCPDPELRGKQTQSLLNG